MINALKAYRFLNLLSIDVSVGAVACAVFFSKLFDVTTDRYSLIALGLSVWIIYTTDHLMDAKRIRQRAVTPRHYFHQEYFTALTVITVVLFVIDIGVVVQIKPALLKAGLSLGTLVGIYLLTQRYFGYVKEFMGAILYTTGVILPAVISLNGSLSNGQLAVIFSFMTIAWINLLLFSLFDRESDEQNSQISFTTLLGEKKTRRLIIVLFVTVLLLDLFMLTRSIIRPLLILSSMSLLLFALFLFRGFFSRNDRFRFVGDAVFLIPLISMIF
jgi:1,4-dihydroxy-2-naphthoate octaprenyltransferase